MKKRMIQLSMLLGLSFVLLTGCGNKSDTNSATAPTDTANDINREDDAMKDDTMQNDAKDDAEDVGDTVGKALDDTGSAAGDVLEDTSDAVGDTVKGAGEAVEDVLDGTQEGMEDATDGNNTSDNTNNSARTAGEAGNGVSGR